MCRRPDSELASDWARFTTDGPASLEVIPEHAGLVSVIVPQGRGPSISDVSGVTYECDSVASFSGLEQLRWTNPGIPEASVVLWSSPVALFEPRIDVSAFSLEPARVPLPGVMLSLRPNLRPVADQRVTPASGNVTFSQPEVLLLKEYLVDSSLLSSQDLCVFATLQQQRAYLTPSMQRVDLSVQFDFFGCLAVLVLDDNGAPVSNKLVRFSSPTRIGSSVRTDETGRAFVRLLPGRWAVSFDNVGRGNWDIYSRQCLAARLPQAAPDFMRVSEEPALIFSLGRVVVRAGDSIDVDSDSTLTSITLGEGSTVNVQQNSTLAISEEVVTTGGSFVVGSNSQLSFGSGASLNNTRVTLSNTSSLSVTGQLSLSGGTSLTVSDGSTLNVTRGINVGQGSSLTVQQNGTVGVTELQFEDRSSVVTLQQGSSVIVSGNLSACNRGNLVLEDGSSLVVLGTFDASQLNITLNVEAPLCETTTVKVATFGSGGAAPPRSISYADGNAGVSLQSSYSGTTLSVAVTLESDDPMSQCPRSADSSTLLGPLATWQLALIAMGIVVLLTTIFSLAFKHYNDTVRTNMTKELHRQVERKRSMELVDLRDELEREMSEVALKAQMLDRDGIILSPKGTFPVNE